SLDRPARERDVQPSFQLVLERIPYEKPFFFAGMQRIVRPKEMIAADDFAAALQPKRSGLDVPDRRPFVGVFDVERRPVLGRHRFGMIAKFLDAACGMPRGLTGVVEPTA